MRPAARWIVVGRVTGAYGVSGWLRIEPYTEDPGAMLRFGEWWLRQDAREWRSVEVIASRMHGKVVLAQLRGIEDRELAEGLKGTEVALPRETLPAPAENEIYWADLVGLEVVNRDGIVLGRVEEVTAHGAHPLLAVRAGTGKDRLIPYVPAIVDAVDVAGGRIEVDWGEDY